MLVEKLRHPAFQSMALLAGVSTINALFSRILMTKFFFDYPIVNLIIQMASTLFSIELARLFNVIKLPAYTFQRGREVLSLSFCYTIAVYLGMNCLDGTTMPIFPFIQRFAPLVVLAAHTCITNSLHTRLAARTENTLIALICIGAAFASIYEWTFDAWSLIYGTFALLMHALTLVQLEKLAEHYTNTLELVYINSFNCLCFFLLADLIQDEIRDSFMYIMTSTTFLFISCLVATTTLGALFHFALFFCVAHAGAVNAAIVNTLANGIQLFIAYGLSVYLFYELAPTWANILGVFVCSIAAGFYCHKWRPSHVTLSAQASAKLDEFRS